MVLRRKNCDKCGGAQADWPGVENAVRCRGM